MKTFHTQISSFCLGIVLTVAHGGTVSAQVERIGTDVAGRTAHAVAYTRQAAPDEALANPFGDDASQLTVAPPEIAPVPNTGVMSSGPGVQQCATDGCPTSACQTPSTCSSCPSASCGVCSNDCKNGCSLGLCSCNLGDAWTISGALHGDCPPKVTIGGWLSAGYHTADNGLFNNRSDKVALHQGWLYAEKAAEACESPLGFRVDVMYGIDAGETQAFGNPGGSWDFQNGFDHGAYGWAIPQAYLEAAIGEWTVKAGHFYTLIGYEVVTAPDNFFYSHAMTMFQSEPFTHTGVLASRSIGENLEVHAGWTLGWDTGFDQLNSGSSWLGGIAYTISDNASLTYMSTAGNFGARGDDAYSHSIVLDMSMTDDLNWVVQSDVLRSDATGEDTVGINQYLLYGVSDCLSLGARLEWWKGDVLTGYAPHNASLPAAGSLSYYAMTLGANVRPHANLVFRPEVRYDWSPAADYEQSYFGVDAILTF